MDEMSVEKWWNEIYARENGRNPEENLRIPRFVHHETHMEGPRRELGTPAVGGERLTACATRIVLLVYVQFIKFISFGLSLEHCMGGSPGYLS